MSIESPDVQGRDLQGWAAPVQHEPATYPAAGQGHPYFIEESKALLDLHLLKSGGYGTGSDPFANFTAVSAVTGRARYEYPIERIVEKVTRLRSLIDQGRIAELGEEYRDIAGLSLCAVAMLREDEPAATRP